MVHNYQGNSLTKKRKTEKKVWRIGVGGVKCVGPPHIEPCLHLHSASRATRLKKYYPRLTPQEGDSHAPKVLCQLPKN